MFVKVFHWLIYFTFIDIGYLAVTRDGTLWIIAYNGYVGYFDSTLRQ